VTLSVASVEIVVSTQVPATQAPATPVDAPFRILVTNDDGVRAPGLVSLAVALAKMGEVWIVAPDQNQSGRSHALTIGTPIALYPLTLPTGQQAYSVDATPVTCVKLAVATLMPVRPHVVIAGINRGNNVGMTAYTAAYVAAAREAALMNIPAMAVGIDARANDYTEAAETVVELVSALRAQTLAAGTFLNVNLPAGLGEKQRGFRLTRQSRLAGAETFAEVRSPAGQRFFFSVYQEPVDETEGTDSWAVRNGYVSVTQLSVGESRDPATFRLPAARDRVAR
jgi:5'-nucleotidase